MVCSAKTLLATVLIWFLHLPHAYSLEPRCLFNRIYQLGDSISDVGNLKQQNPKFGCALPPYGQNFFHKETGRCSNGLLIIDYIAQSVRIPFLGAYLNPNAKFEGGVNFAVAGSTALPTNVLAKRKIFNPATNNSLTTQLDWMSTYFNTTCYKNSDCTKKLKSSLFMVGEIGGNDYNYALLQNKTIQDVNSMVPEVVLAIKDAVKRVIGLGAKQVIVPGNFPIGCLPIYLTLFKSNDTRAYDKFNCLKNLNKAAIYHNKRLQQTIDQLKKEHHNVIIGYGDYYNAYRRILRRAPSLGFDVNYLQKACCGIGGEYNFNFLKRCGSSGVAVCAEPNRFISWDGIHLTQAAYNHIYNLLLIDFQKYYFCI